MASIFTKIINGEIPCHKIAEDEHHFAFLDINPVSSGHTLVVPKEEIDYLFDVPDERLATMMAFSKKLAHAIDKATGCIRTGIIVEGLEVPHAHIHLIPIYRTDQIVSLKEGKPADQDELKKTAEKIRNTLGE